VPIPGAGTGAKATQGKSYVKRLKVWS